MALTDRESGAQELDIFDLASSASRARIQVACPGIIESFDADAITASVQPAIQGIATRADGRQEFVDLPLLLDVPVVFPRGGDCTLTFPVAKGDECLIVFGQRCIDAWWQSGGVQPPAELRMHDLSDGFAIPGPYSQATKIGGVSTSATQLRSNDGSTYFELNPSSQKIKIVAPGGFDVVAPLSTFSAAVTINGLLTWLAGMIGSTSITGGVAAKITGVINFFGQLTANGKRIDDTHTHSDVQFGSDNSGPVN